MNVTEEQAKADRNIPELTRHLKWWQSQLSYVEDNEYPGWQEQKKIITGHIDEISRAME